MGLLTTVDNLQLATGALIGNRRKTGRIINPPQDGILPHTKLTHYGRGHSRV